MAFRQTYFCDEWLLEKSFEGIIKADPNNKTVALCLLCSGKSRTIHLSNMGKRALLSHCSGKKHMARVRDRNTSVSIGLFTPTSSPSAASGSSDAVQAVNALASATALPGAGGSDTTSATTSASLTPLAPAAPRPEGFPDRRNLREFVLRDDVTKAEIWWDLFTVETHLSLRAAGRATKLFAKMFPDSTIASKVEQGRTKIGYSINHGLAQYFFEDLVRDINCCDAFVAYFDESLNKFSQQQQMDVAVRFWFNSKDEVSTRYFNSAFLGHTTADDLRSALLGCLKTLNVVKKLLMVSMDGPNVNLKLIKDLEVYLNSIKDPIDTSFLYMGSCGLHVMNNAFKTAFSDVHDWKIIIFIRSLYNLFKDVPARRSDLVRVSRSSLLPLKFCAIRWLQNKQTAVRAKELIPNLVVYLEYVEKDPKRKITSFSYSVVKKGVEDPLMPSKLTFFCSLADEVEPFLREFQSKEPMAPFLYTEMNAVLVNLLTMIVKKEIMDKKTSVHTIDLSDSKNLILAKNFKFKLSVKVELRKVKLTDKQMLDFKTDCIEIVKKMCVKLIEKSPLKFKLCKAITFCDPAELTDNQTTCFGRLEMALTIFQEKNWISGAQGDDIMKEFKKLCSKSDVKLAFKSYDRSKVRLDHFWRGIVVSAKVSDLLWNFLKMVLILSHGNADVERGFSINKELIVENQLNESLVAQRQVYGGLQELGGVEKMTDIPKGMILKVRNSYSLYKEDLNKKKKEKESKAESDVVKKRLIDQVEELKRKKTKILAEKQRELDDIQEKLDAIAPGLH